MLSCEVNGKKWRFATTAFRTGQSEHSRLEEAQEAVVTMNTRCSALNRSLMAARQSAREAAEAQEFEQVTLRAELTTERQSSKRLDLNNALLRDQNKREVEA